MIWDNFGNFSVSLSVLFTTPRTVRYSNIYRAFSAKIQSREGQGVRAKVMEESPNQWSGLVWAFLLVGNGGSRWSTKRSVWINGMVSAGSN
jgi:hypothetical protein